MRNSPQLRNIPKQLPDTHIAVLSGSTWQRFGCTAQLPWTNVEKDRDGRMVAVRSLADKTWVMFSAPEFQPDTAKIYRESAERDPNGKKVVQLIGAENLASKFNFMRAAAYTRPQDASIFATREHNVRTMLLLGQKITLMEGSLYELHFGEMRGFQEGDAPNIPIKVKLDLFDPQDRRIELWIRSDKTSSASITQPQINAIIQSIHCR
ncbi:hypothetical protein EDE15_0421 [Edaphobacter aggregans]|uniref:Uncharacterized protein n=1 Tax=Edaphobacter aggregans TaxID=570835 RepID=A0A3R9P739_9BACT|nr:hypothetical protein [Edaphobacter aggregans]RSL14951.1 hypothetical protein EDE15_0421 [Edaphobacter aggregans]